MLRVDSKQGAPKDGNSPLELFQVIDPLPCLFFSKPKNFIGFESQDHFHCGSVIAGPPNSCTIQGYCFGVSGLVFEAVF